MHGTLDYTDWTPARVDDLQRFIKEKYTARQAAEELGVSRNSVIGKARRHGWRFDSEGVRNVHVRVREREARRIAPRPPRPPRPNHAPPMAPEPFARGLSFDQLERNDCLYPVTADHPFKFCGHPKTVGQPYCPHHCGIAYRPADARNRDARPR